MLRILQTQVNVLTSPLVKRLSDRCCREVSAALPTMAEGAIRDRVATHLEECRRFGFSRDDSIVKYVLLCMQYEQHRSPLLERDDVNNFLTRSDLKEAAKLYLVEEVVLSDELVGRG